MSVKVINRMNDLLALSHVPRWSIVPRIHDQSVADHSFRVAVIALELRDRLHVPNVSVERLLLYALSHDVEESRSGDISAAYKSHCVLPDGGVAPYVSFNPREFAGLTDDSELLWLVKLADLIEARTFLSRYSAPISVHSQRVLIELDWKIDDHANLHLKGLFLEVVRAVVREIETDSGR